MSDNLPLHASRTETLLIRQRLADTMTALGQGVRGLLPNLDDAIVLLELQHAAYYWSVGALGYEPEAPRCARASDCGEGVRDTPGTEKLGSAELEANEVGGSLETQSVDFDPVEPRTVFAKGTGVTDLPTYTGPDPGPPQLCADCGEVARYRIGSGPLPCACGKTAEQKTWADLVDRCKVGSGL